MKKVFFCGEVVVDMLEQKSGSGDFKLFLGGSHYNSAIGAARAVKKKSNKIKPYFIGTISNDMFGNRFCSSLQSEGVDISYVTRVPYNTTLAMVSIREGKENDFSFYSEATSTQMTKLEDLPSLKKLTPKDSIFCFGSISTVLEPARFAWFDFAKRLRGKTLIYYDLNTRPSIAKNKKEYLRILNKWASIADIIRASDADVRWPYGNMELKKIAKLWMRKGVSIVVFTKGNKGAEAYFKNFSVNVPTLNLKVKNTIGAGDNMNAGLVLALAKRNFFSRDNLKILTEGDLRKILSEANETAANHLISLGAKPLKK